MSERTVIAYFEVDEDRAFDGFGDGPVPYLEHEAVCLEKSGIFLAGAAIADEGSISGVPCKILLRALW